MLSKIIKFLKTDIWRIRIKNYPRSKSFFLRQLRIIVLSVRGFDEDKCKFRASALTFYSLLSVVPVIAMMFGVAKGFGLEKKVETELINMVRSVESDGHQDNAHTFPEINFRSPKQVKKVLSKFGYHVESTSIDVLKKMAPYTKRCIKIH